MSTIESDASAAAEERWPSDVQWSNTSKAERAGFIAGYLAASRREPSEASANVSNRPKDDISSDEMSVSEPSNTDEREALAQPSYWHQPTYEFLHRDAADAIEKLEAENESLRIDNLGPARDRHVAAEALRTAAASVPRMSPPHDVTLWLRNRANQIESP